MKPVTRSRSLYGWMWLTGATVAAFALGVHWACSSVAVDHFQFLGGRPPIQSEIRSLLNPRFNAEGVEVREYGWEGDLSQTINEAADELPALGYKLRKRDATWAEWGGPTSEISVFTDGPGTNLDVSHCRISVLCENPMPYGLQTHCRLVVRGAVDSFEESLGLSRRLH